MENAALQQIESALSQMEHYGDDEEAFKAYMTIISPLVGLYADEGKFRSLARSQWLSGNKAGLKKIVRSVVSGPTLVQQRNSDRAEMAEEKKAIDALVALQTASLFALMGFRKGDVLTVKGSDGDDRQIAFNNNLPELGQSYAEWIENSVPREVKERLGELFPEGLPSLSGQLGQ